jgi:chromosome segregation ATPase
VKEAITGYITGIINSYTRSIDRLKKAGAPIGTTNPFVSFKEEFSDLLEFVIDVPEENKEFSILALNIALENVNLNKRIAELEESCSNMCEVENNLHGKIKKLEANLIEFRGAFIEDKQKIKEIEEEKNEFWECNKQLNQLYKGKQSENEIIQTQNKKLKYDNKKLHKKIELLRKKSNGPTKRNV